MLPELPEQGWNQGLQPDLDPWLPLTDMQPGDTQVSTPYTLKLLKLWELLSCVHDYKDSSKYMTISRWSLQNVW